MKYLLWLLFCLLVITGCASTKRLVIESEYIRAVMNSGQVTDTIKTADLSDAELLQLTHAINKFKSFLDTYDDPTDALMKGGERLERDYQEVRAAYLDLHGLAQNNWTEFRPGDKDLLLEWDERARKFDKEALRFARLKDYQAMASEAVSYARLGVALFMRIAAE